MKKQPEAFADVKSRIAIAPLKGRTTIERNCEQMQIPVDEGVDAFETICNQSTGLHVTRQAVELAVAPVRTRSGVSPVQLWKAR